MSDYPYPSYKPSTQTFEQPVRQELTLVQTFADGRKRVIEVNPDAVQGLITVDAGYSAEHEPDWSDGLRFVPGRSYVTEMQLTIEATLRSPFNADGLDAGCVTIIDVPAPEQVGPCRDPHCTLDHEPATTTFMGQPVMNEKARQHKPAAAGQTTEETS
ncbi:hypothetical protein HOT31_gp041 [Microbacterium phage Hendrix]|uniref:Uncharacterized protein n=1 Tax=Microbacterium phage Hendrix TaxID=2182341 RepID=A0A2U8UUG3_9CAUD|nr:hypothetical protein HOT31_gp041 [Microbacterium phage Hendrix]AWN07712.1 hypothetical protein PBI_HENDRIX_41 [Microbacterium phage Hendrix]